MFAIFLRMHSTYGIVFSIEALLPPRPGSGLSLYSSRIYIVQGINKIYTVSTHSKLVQVIHIIY